MGLLFFSRDFFIHYYEDNIMKEINKMKELLDLFKVTGKLIVRSLFVL